MKSMYILFFNMKSVVMVKKAIKVTYIEKEK